MSKTNSGLTAATTPLTGTEVVYLVQGGNSRKGTTASFYIPGGTDVAVVDGGTGASTASGARTNLGLAIGTDIQAFSANLSSWAAITRAAGFDTFVATPSSANLLALLTTKTGTGNAVFSTSAILTTPDIGTATGTNLTLSAMTASLPVFTNGSKTLVTVANATAFDTLAPTTTRGDLIFRNATTNTRLAAGTSGYALIAAGAGADPAWTGYTQGGTGSLIRSWQNRLQDQISVLDFTGVDPTGVSDSRAGIVAADAAAAALGKALYFPSGTYLVSAAITPSSFACWIGESKAKTILKITSATADLLAVSNGQFYLDSISFGTTVTRTGGNYINISASVVSITNFTMSGTFQGIFLSAAVSTIYVARGNITTTHASSIGLRLAGGVAVEFKDLIIIWDGVTHPFACLYITNGGDYSFLNCQFLAGTNCGQIQPAAGQTVAYCRFTNCWFDTALGVGLSIAPTSTGIITGCDFVQCWFSSSGTHGVQINPGASASVVNVNFANCFLINNASSGFTMSGAVISDCNFINNTINNAAVGNGFSLSSTVNRIRIQGNRISGNVNGILSDGTPTGAMIYDNSFFSNTNNINGAFLSSQIDRNTPTSVNYNGQVLGTATNDAASAGNVGEYVAAVSPNSTATVTMTIATPCVVTWASNPYVGSAQSGCNWTAPIVFTTTGALPTGITSGTTYWVIGSSVSGNTFQVATSSTNALAGTAVATSGTQSGVHTGTSTISLSTGTSFDMGAISLSPGDWDADIVFNFKGGTTTTVNAFIASLSLTAATLDATQGRQVALPQTGATPFNNVTVVGIALPPVRLSLSATTSVFAPALVTFGVSTCNAFGIIRARRVR